MLVFLFPVQCILSSTYVLGLFTYNLPIQKPYEMFRRIGLISKLNILRSKTVPFIGQHNCFIHLISNRDNEEQQNKYSCGINQYHGIIAAKNSS